STPLFAVGGRPCGEGGRLCPRAAHGGTEGRCRPRPRGGPAGNTRPPARLARLVTPGLGQGEARPRRATDLLRGTPLAPAVGGPFGWAAGRLLPRRNAADSATSARAGTPGASCPRGLARAKGRGIRHGAGPPGRFTSWAA